VIGQLVAEGADVRVFDPAAAPRLSELTLEAQVAADVETACHRAELVMVLTDWDDFGRLDPTVLRRVVAEPRCLDGRQVIDTAKWRDAGWSVYVMGEDGTVRA